MADTNNAPTPGTVVDGYTFAGGDPSNPRSWVRQGMQQGQVMDGYHYLGGDPSDQNNWQKVGYGEDILNSIKSTGKKIGGAALKYAGPVLSSLLPISDEEWEKKAKGLQDQGEQLVREGNQYQPQTVPGMVAGGLTYAPAAIVDPAVAAGVMLASEGEAASQNLQSKGVDKHTADLAGISQAAPMAAVSMVPLGNVVFGQGVGPLAKSVVSAGVKSGVAGAAQSVVGDTAASSILDSAGYADAAKEAAPTLEKAKENALFMAGMHLGAQAGSHALGKLTGANINVGQEMPVPEVPTPKSVSPELAKNWSEMSAAEQMRAVRDMAITQEGVKAAQDAAKAEAVNRITAPQTTVDDAIAATKQLADSSAAMADAQAQAQVSPDAFKVAMDQAEARRIDALRSAIDQHVDLLRNAEAQANETNRAKAFDEVRQQITQDLPGRGESTVDVNALPQATPMDVLQAKQAQVDATKAQIPDLNVPESVAPASQAERGPGYAFADMTPMSSVQARGRLAVLRDEYAQAGKDPSALEIAQHPGVESVRTPIGEQPAFAIKDNSKTEAPFRYDTEAQGRVEPEKVQQPAIPDNGIDPIDAYVNIARRSEIPADRQFVHDYDAGRITREDVQRAIDLQRRMPQTLEQALTEQAGLTPAEAQPNVRQPSAERQAAIDQSWAPKSESEGSSVEQPQAPQSTESQQASRFETDEPPIAPVSVVRGLKVNTNSQSLAKAVNAGDMAGVVNVLASSRNPVLSRLGELARPFAGQIGVQTTSTRQSGRWGSDAGHYAPDLNAVAIRPNFAGHEQVVAHEITHALVYHAIEAPTEMQKPFVQRLDALYRSVRKQMRGNNAYGLRSLHEFVSEAMSNPEFQRELANIKYGDGTGWSKFVQFVSRMLGFKSPTALTEVLHLTESLATTRPRDNVLPVSSGEGREVIASERPVNEPAKERADEQVQETAPPAKEVSPARKIFGPDPNSYPAGSVARKGAEIVRDVGQRVADVATQIKNDLLLKLTPMSVGSERAQSLAKDYANADRLARWQWQKFDEILRTKFTPEERKAMWEAGDEENVLRQQGKTPGEGEGLNRLTQDQRDTMQVLHEYGEQLLQRAKDAGLFKGEGLPYWTPRIAVMIDEGGNYYNPKGATRIGKDITTSSGSLKQRKYLTTEETEAAMQSALGDQARVARDIRTMPLAMARLERAIAGRELINGIKEVGERAGQELFTTDAGKAKGGFFTLDTPAFKEWAPKVINNPNTGKPTWAKDQFGNVVYEQKPIYIAKEFEGPLRAIMGERSGKTYQALMSLKGKTMSVIMYSPLIHNMVEFGRALPMVGPRIFSTYVEGYRLRQNPEFMRKAISDGMSPIGGADGARQDITGIMEDANLQNGKSWTAKVLGGTVGLVNKNAGEAVKGAVDKAGHFWHNTLLWDRIADLQAGLYSQLKDEMLRKGLSEDAAGKLAAHWANRFAGALPNEAMSTEARKVANLVLFSRSFTLGNLGAIKDIVTGMPKDVQAQILKSSGELTLATAKSVARRKALGAFIVDLAVMYAANTVAQEAFKVMFQNKSKDDLAQGWADRYNALKEKFKNEPLHVLDSPLESFESLLPTSENEPNKTDRIHIGPTEAGRDVYMRLPLGKVGEDFKGWVTSPLQTLKNKTSPFVRPLVELWNNDNGIGQRIYDPDAKGFSGVLKNAGRIVASFMGHMVPESNMQSAADWAKGNATTADKLQVLGPLIGLSFSQGALGGPAAGEMAAAERRYMGQKADAMPDVKQAIKEGDLDKASTILEDIGMPQPEIRSTIRRLSEPETRLGAASVRKFNQRATDEERERFERQRDNE